MHISQIETPALILDLDLFEENMRTMQTYVDRSGAVLRPHYKSNKCTWIAHRQMEAGAKGITCAKLSEAEDLIFAGIEDVLIANQVTDPAKIARVASLAKCCCLTLCVDNEENIRALEAAAALQDAQIHILVEYDIGMLRCGVTEPEQFLELARLVEACPHLTFDGIQAYAGQLAHESDYEKRKAGSAWVETRLRELKAYVEAAGLQVREVSGTSTGTVEFRGEGTVYTELQAGSYVLMDSTYKNVGAQFQQALFLLTQVVSVVGKERTMLDGGLKSVSVDQDPPVLLDDPGEPLAFSEEHITLQGTKPEWSLGKRMKLVPSHCCTVMNMHDYIYLVRGDKVVDRQPITSRGKSR